MEITKIQVIKNISRDTSLKQEHVGKVVHALIQEIQQNLKHGHSVKFVNFGKFVPKENKAGMKRNPKTSQPVYKEASVRPHFTAFDGFKDAVNGGGNGDH